MNPSQIVRYPVQLVLLVGMLACSDAEPAPQPAPRTAQTAGDDQASTERRAFDRAHHMQASLWLALSARDAVIDGKLEEARTAARELAAHDYGQTIPQDWKKWLGDMRMAAEQVVLASGLEEAAQGVGALGLACGNCHYQHAAGPNMEREPPMEWREPNDTVDERMERHAKGVAQMWAGLVVPSEEAWRSGTVTLTRAPLAPPQAEDGSVGPRTAAEIERMRDIAQRARTAGSHVERAKIYGDLIASCGHCHTTTPRSM